MAGRDYLKIAGLTVVLLFIGVMILAQSMMQVAQETPGFKPSMVYENFGNGESVNTANGGLTVVHSSAISLPQNKGGNLGFTRVYNSKYRSANDPSDMTEPSFGFLGPGWKLSFGRVFLRVSSYTLNTQTIPLTQWLYEDESGAEHRLYMAYNDAPPSSLETMAWPINHEADLPNQTKWYVTNDGSYLVAKFILGSGTTFEDQMKASYWTIYYPDGSKRIAGGNASAFVVPEKTATIYDYVVNEKTNGWYVTQIIDRVSNMTSIHYRAFNPPVQPYAGSILKVTDNSLNRTIYFDVYGNEGTNQGGNCPVGNPNYPPINYLNSINKVGLLKNLRYEYQSTQNYIQKSVVENYDYDLFQFKGDGCQAYMLTSVVDPENLETRYHYSIPGGDLTLSPTPMATLTAINYPTGATSQYEHETFGYITHKCDAQTEPCWEMIEIKGGVAVKIHSLEVDAPNSNTTNILRWTWDRDYEPDFYLNLAKRTYPVITTDPYGTKEIHYFAYNNLADTDEIQAGHERHVYKLSQGTNISDPIVDNPLNYSIFHVKKEWESTALGLAQYCYDYINLSLPQLALNANPRVINSFEEERNPTVPLWQKQTDFKYNDGFGHFLLTETRKVSTTNVMVNAVKYDLYHDISSDPRNTELNYQLDRAILDYSGIADTKTTSGTTITYGSAFKAVMKSYNEQGLLTAEKDYKLIQSALQFNAMNGIVSTPTSNASDRLIAISYEPGGNISQLTYSGGDPDASGNRKAYSVKFDWDYAMVSRMIWLDEGGSEFNYPEFTRSIEPGTSRIISETDSNEITTLFEYDDLGRITKIDPQGDEVPAIIEYPLDNNASPGMGHVIKFYKGNGPMPTASPSNGGSVSLNDGSFRDIYTYYEFDGLGRLWKTSNVMPDSHWSCNEKFYDPVGNIVFESYPYSPDDSTISFETTGLSVVSEVSGGSICKLYPPKRTDGAATRYYGIWSTPFSGATFDSPFAGVMDGFYRPQLVLKPDGGKMATIYAGLNTKVRNYIDSTNYSETNYTKDIFGRLTNVVAPVTTAGTYTYDGLSNLISASISGQPRTFTYDALGNLRSAATPESGTVTYENYDALGNLLKYTDALGNIIYNGYDAKGRILYTSKGYFGNMLRKWVYDVSDYSPGSNGLSYGKLVYSAAKRESSSSFDTIETQYYQGPNGRLSRTGLQLMSSEYSIEYGYDPEYGFLTSESIPELQGYIQFPILSTYKHGSLASKTFSDGKGLTESNYNPSGSLAYLAYSNSIMASYAEDQKMTRLSSISVSRKEQNNSITDLWKTGAYTYDMAGNITKIGDPLKEGYGLFAYDALFRLTSASVNHVDPDTYQMKTLSFNYSYDKYGNMLNRTVNSATKTMLTSWLGTTGKNTFVSETEFSSVVSTSTNRFSTITRLNAETFNTETTSLADYYDANGNMTFDGTYTLTYDPLNQLLKSSKGALATQKNEINIHDASGERVVTINYTGLDSSPVDGKSIYYIRSGSRILAEFSSYFNGTTTTTRRYKAYLYAGSNLVTTAEKEATISTMSSVGTGVRICPSALVQLGFSSRLPSIGDPMISLQNGQKFSASFIMNCLGENFVGAMVRIARIKDQGNTNDNGIGNGKKRSDEDKVETFYFMQDGLDADFVFRRYGLETNQGYGEITQLIPGMAIPIILEDLQMDKKYRISFSVWTSIGADPLIGYNLVDMEEGEFTVPKSTPAYHFHSKVLDKEDNEGVFKGILRSTWADMSASGAVKYNIRGKNKNGSSIILNHEPVTGTEYEITLDELEQKNYLEGSGYSIEGLDSIGTPLISIGDIGGGIILEPIKCRIIINPMFTPPDPTDLTSFLINSGGSKQVALFWNGVNTVGDSQYQVPVAYEVYIKIRTGTNSSTTLLTTTADFFYLDATPPPPANLTFISYQVRAITQDSYQAASSTIEIPVDLTQSAISPATNLRVVSLTGPTGQRTAQLGWNGVSLASSTLKYDIYRSVAHVSGTDCALIVDGDFVKIGETDLLSFTDDSIPDIYQNPLVAYKICVGDPTWGCVTSFTNCASTHCALCPTPPEPPVNLYGYSENENVTLLWTAPDALGTYEYLVYKGDLRFGSGEFKAKTPSTTFTMVIGSAGVTPFSVITINSSTGCRSSVSFVEVSTSGNCTSPPSAPTSLTLTDSNDVFVLKWNSVTGATQYKVFRADGASGEEPLQYVGTFSQNGYAEYVEPGTAVTYGVAAINSNGCESSPSIKTGIKGTNPGNSGPTYYYYTEDHLGSVRLILDANGNIISRLDYEPYGTLLPKTSPASISSPENKILFTGQERDSFTGHDNMHFRHYASKIGRFMKPDNMMGDLGNTQSWNLYSYVRGNPVNYNDPTGHLPPGALTDWTVNNTQTEEQLNKFDAARQEGLSLLNVGEAWSETAEAVGAGASAEEIAYAAIKDTIRTVVAIDLAVTGAKILGGVASKAVTKTVTTQTASKTATEMADGVTTKGVSQGSRVNKVAPHPDASGPHTSFKTDASGKVTGYTEYNATGQAVKRFRGEGKAHGGQEPPLILEPKAGKGSGSPPKVPRPANPDELPEGY